MGKRQERKGLRSKVRAGIRTYVPSKHWKNGFSTSQVFSRSVWTIVKDFRLQNCLDGNLEMSHKSFFSGKKPNSFHLLANAQYLYEVFCFPKCLRTRSRVCCYWDLIPHGDSVGRDWIPGGTGRDLAFSHHRNIILILYSQLFAPSLKSSWKSIYILIQLCFAQRGKNSAVVFV